MKKKCTVTTEWNEMKCSEGYYCNYCYTATTVTAAATAAAAAVVSQ